MRVVLYILSVILVFFAYLYEDTPCSIIGDKDWYESNPNNRPFKVITSISHGVDLVPSGTVGEVPLPVPGIPRYKPKPPPKSGLSKGSFHGIQEDWGFKKPYNEVRLLENAYHTVKRDNCYGIDKVFAEYPNEIDTSYAYFVRFRIRPDGSVRDVDIINRKFGHREINVIGDDEKYSYGVGLPDGFNTDGLEKALLSEMGGWRFPESEGDITHYCWLYYRDY